MLKASIRSASFKVNCSFRLILLFFSEYKSSRTAPKQREYQVFINPKLTNLYLITKEETYTNQSAPIINLIMLIRLT